MQMNFLKHLKRRRKTRLMIFDIFFTLFFPIKALFTWKKENIPWSDITRAFKNLYYKKHICISHPYQRMNLELWNFYIRNILKPKRSSLFRW